MSYSILRKNEKHQRRHQTWLTHFWSGITPNVSGFSLSSMTRQHCATPPPELLKQWYDAWFETDRQLSKPVYIANCAAQWGADQELEACLTEVSFLNGRALADRIRAGRRPISVSLKEQALIALHAIATGANDMREQYQDLKTIREALDQLDD